LTDVSGQVAAAGQAPRADAARELAALWQRISPQLVGAQGCACCFGGMMLQASDFELDVIEFVIGDARKAKRPDVEAYIERVAKRGPHRYSLPGLLDAVAAAGEGAAAGDLDFTLDFILARLRVTLTAIEAAHSGSRFACD